MKRSWIIAMGGALLWMAAGSPCAQAAARVKKAKAPVSVKKGRKVPVLPMRPPADIPTVTETASLSQGCLEPRQLPALASRLGMDEYGLGTLLSGEGLVASEGRECIRYVAATGGEGGVASAAFQRPEPEASRPPIVAVRKTAEGITVTPGACDCPEPERRVINLPARDVKELPAELLADVPKSVQWQLGILLPRMMAGVTPETEAADLTVVVTIGRHADTELEHLHSIEINEAASGKRVDGVWWLERRDGPGVFVGMGGVAYERALWQTPVNYVQKSRGVGPAMRTIRTKAAAPKGKGNIIVRAIRVVGYHLGVDMMAPKGYDVHAVGDATVAFSGRQGGFGNLVILDHGLGYQTYYAHLSKIERGMKPGAKVAGGEIIGLVGSTGHSTGPHLHFETRKDAKYIDPFDDKRELGFWLLTADEQEKLAMQLLTPAREDRDASRTETPAAQ